MRDNVEIFLFGRRYRADRLSIQVKQQCRHGEAGFSQLRLQLRRRRRIDHDTEIMRAVQQDSMLAVPLFKRPQTTLAQRTGNAALDIAKGAQAEPYRIGCPFQPASICSKRRSG